MRPFVLLQLSDLHFGPHSRFGGLDMGELARRCAEAIREAREALGWREEVALVLVTGDVAEAARPKEYEAALACFGELVAALGVPRSAVVFVPGNHDVSWTQCEVIEGQLRDGLFEEAELRARLDEVKLARFDDMVARFYDPALPRHAGQGRGPVRPAAAGKVTALPRGAYVHDFEELGVSVAALDSCEAESHRAADHRGLVGKVQAQGVLSHWAAEDPATRLRIVAVHHNPVPTLPSAIREWRDWLRAQVQDGKLKAELVDHFAADAVGFEGHERLQALAADAQVSLLLHGHHHASDAVHAWGWRGKHAGDTRIISAGSWGLAAGKLPAEQPVVMQLVRVDPEARTVAPVLLRYEPRGRAGGAVEPGAFVLDEVTRAHAPLALSLPAGAAHHAASGPRHTPPPSMTLPPARTAAALVAAYHARMRNTFVRWDLRAVGAAPTVGNNRPVDATLDDMYIPLRFADRYESKRLGSGAPIEPRQLLERKAPLVIIGNAGSGKTTWMRQTFRKLIAARTAVPFFLELRAVAASWEKRPEAERTIEALLADELRKCGVAGWEAGLGELLDGTSGLRPVLLVDGWDELGDLGERLRRCLGEFRAAHERAVIAVSSRPYGESRPAGSEGFETLHIQPLDDADVRLLTHKFHRRVHGEEEPAAEKSTGDFVLRLAAVPEAQALARTALLLTMMLLLSREGPLPDKRHKLYRDCLRNLLDARPALRESEGAQLRRGEWRPADQEERLRAVAEMAFRIQSGGYLVTRGSILRSWEDAAQLLPEAWTREDREGFLLWLINSAGVLVDRSDGAISFAHLSFQEFLAAHHLFATYEGEARTQAVLSHAGNLNWWETLRLWAGLTGDLSPEKLTPVLEALRDKPHSFWLAGSILADGTGQAADFEAWRSCVSGRLIRRAWPAAHQCARAWEASKQADRRGLLAAVSEAAAAGSHWLDGIDLMDWSLAASFEALVSTDPDEGLHGRVVHRMLESPSPLMSPDLLAVMFPTVSSARLARSRALSGASWLWPGDVRLIFLRLWPSSRVRASATLQTLASLRADRAAVIGLAPVVIERERRAPVAPVVDAAFVRDLVAELVRDFDDAAVPDFVQDLVRGFARDYGWDFMRSFDRDLRWYLRRYLARWLSPQLSWKAAGWVSWRDFVRDFVQYLSQHLGPRFGPHFAAAIAERWGVTSEVAAIEAWEELVLIEAASVASRASVRAAVAHSNRPTVHGDEHAVLQLACLVSLGHEPAAALLEDALARYEGDPLWPALARHVARRSTPEDRALLEDAATRPEQREAPVSWMLQHHVRGDLVLESGEIVSMNALCDELGLPHLPLLEEMPAPLGLVLGGLPG